MKQGTGIGAEVPTWVVWYMRPKFTTITDTLLTGTGITALTIGTGLGTDTVIFVSISASDPTIMIRGTAGTIPGTAGILPTGSIATRPTVFIIMADSDMDTGMDMDIMCDEPRHATIPYAVRHFPLRGPSGGNVCGVHPLPG